MKLMVEITSRAGRDAFLAAVIATSALILGWSRAWLPLSESGLTNLWPKAQPKSIECNPFHPDVVIVGGGLAGLSAAYRLKQAGKCVTIVEAGPFVGGQCRNWRAGDVHDHTKKGSPIVGKNVLLSVGGSFFDPYREENLMLVFRELGLASLRFPPFGIHPSFVPPMVFPEPLISSDPTDHLILAHLHDIGSRYQSLKDAPIGIQMMQNVLIDVWMDMTYPNLHANVTAKQIVREFMWFQSSQDPRKIDAFTTARWVADLIPLNLNGFPMCNNIGLIHQLWGGTGQLTERFHNMLAEHGVTFIFNTKIVQIDHSDVSRGLYVNGSKPDGNPFSILARHNVIVAVPAKQASQIRFHPALSKPTRAVMNGSETFDTINKQVFVFFKSQWWLKNVPPRANAILPSYALYRNLEGQVERLPKLFGYAAPVPPLEIQSNETTLLWGLMRFFVAPKHFRSTSETLHQDVVDLVRFFNFSVSFEDVMDVKVFDWGNEVEYTAHALFKPRALAMNLKNNYLQVNGGREGAVVFAGAHIAKTWTNYMEGAVSSGFHAADSILSTL